MALLTGASTCCVYAPLIRLITTVQGYLPPSLGYQIPVARYILDELERLSDLNPPNDNVLPLGKIYNSLMIVPSLDVQTDDEPGGNELA